MKFFLIIALSLITLKGVAQVKQYNNSLSGKSTDTTLFNVSYTDKSNLAWPPMVYVNSLMYHSVPCMDPNDIASIDVRKGKDFLNKTDGIIRITLKKKDVHFITIGELTQKCIPGFDAKNRIAVYSIDDKLIDDASTAVFESSYIKNIEILDYSKDSHYIGPVSNLVLIKIYTQSAPVYIKGASSEASIIR